MMAAFVFSNSPRGAFERESCFADCLREVRRRVAVKQTCLSLDIGCSDAAVSFWEAGHRLPTYSNLRRLLQAMGAAGATAAEQLALREAWFRDKSRAARLPRGDVQYAAGSSERLDA